MAHKRSAPSVLLLVLLLSLRPSFPHLATFQPEDHDPARPEPHTTTTTTDSVSGYSKQDAYAPPHVPQLVARLAHLFSSTKIIDVGCRLSPTKSPLNHQPSSTSPPPSPSDPSICLAFYNPPSSGHSRTAIGRLLFSTNIPLSAAFSSVPLIQDLFRHSTTLVTQPLELTPDPYPLLHLLSQFSRTCDVLLLTFRDRASLQSDDDDPPVVTSRPRHEWSLPEFKQLLSSLNMNTIFCGRTWPNVFVATKTVGLCVVGGEGWDFRQPPAVPEEFGVVAIMTSFNEEDVIASMLYHHARNGVQVYLVDMWSTDSTFAIAQFFLGTLLVGLEHFPPEGPPSSWELAPMYERKEQLAALLPAHWIINADADEIYESPFPGLTVREGLYIADQLGFNVVDLTNLHFRPVDDSFPVGPPPDLTLLPDPLTLLPYYEASDSVGLERIWKSQPFVPGDNPRAGHGARVHLVETGGQGVDFDYSDRPPDEDRQDATQTGNGKETGSQNGSGRSSNRTKRIFPFKFLYRHYSFRSEAHGRKKVFADRLARCSAEDLSKGWNVHYVAYAEAQKFLWRREELRYFDEHVFYEEEFVERLSAIGYPSYVCGLDEDGNYVCGLLETPREGALHES